MSAPSTPVYAGVAPVRSRNARARALRKKSEEVSDLEEDVREKQKENGAVQSANAKLQRQLDDMQAKREKI